jgi:hypothetical protein
MPLRKEDDPRPDAGTQANLFFGFANSSCCCSPELHSWGEIANNLSVNAATVFNRELSLHPYCVSFFSSLNDRRIVRCPLTFDCSPIIHVRKQHPWIRIYSNGRDAGFALAADGKIYGWGRNTNFLPSYSDQWLSVHNTTGFFATPNRTWFVPVDLEFDVGSGFYVDFSAQLRNVTGITLIELIAVVDSNGDVHCGTPTTTGQPDWQTHALDAESVAIEGNHVFALGKNGKVYVTNSPKTSAAWSERTAQFIEEVIVGSGGSNYSGATTVTFSGGNGTGGIAVPQIGAGGVITSVIVEDGGTDYTTTPSVIISDPNNTGSGANAAAVLHPATAKFKYISQPRTLRDNSASRTVAITTEGMLCVVSSTITTPYDIGTQYSCGYVANSDTIPLVFALVATNSATRTPGEAMVLGQSGFFQDPRVANSIFVPAAGEPPFVYADFCRLSEPLTSSSDTSVLAIDESGYMWGWGRNTEFQLGDGTGTNRSAPVKIGNHRWSSVFFGCRHGVQDGSGNFAAAIHDDFNCTLEKDESTPDAFD